MTLLETQKTKQNKLVRREKQAKGYVLKVFVIYESNELCVSFFVCGEKVEKMGMEVGEF